MILDGFPGINIVYLSMMLHIIHIKLIYVDNIPHLV
jgi:hypothetical protein